MNDYVENVDGRMAPATNMANNKTLNANCSQTALDTVFLYRVLATRVV